MAANCKCTVRPVSEAEMERRDWAVTPDEAIPDLEQSKIDPAFDYNVGKAAFGKKVADKQFNESNKAFRWQTNAISGGYPLDKRTYKEWGRPDFPRLQWTGP